jgi:hypothetical protein
MNDILKTRNRTDPCFKKIIAILGTILLSSGLFVEIFIAWVSFNGFYYPSIELMLRNTDTSYMRTSILGKESGIDYDDGDVAVEIECPSFLDRNKNKRRGANSKFL